MRPDQYEKLKRLSEKLLDVFLDEANPDHWPGAGIKPNMMDKATRGDRVWVKKDAAATAVLSMKIEGLTGMHEQAMMRTGGMPEPADGNGASEGDDMDAVVAQAEREAAALLVKVQRRQVGG